MLQISSKDYRPLAEKAVKYYARTLFSGYFSKEQLEDIISDVVAKMWAKRAQYDENRGAVSTWVGIIALSAVIDAANAEKRRRERFSSAPLVEDMNEDGDVVNYVPMTNEQADDWLIANDTERRFRNSITSERDLRLLEALLNDSSREELAAAEGVSMSAIYGALHHLRKRLRSVN